MMKIMMKWNSIKEIVKWVYMMALNTRTAHNQKKQSYRLWWGAADKWNIKK